MAVHPPGERFVALTFFLFESRAARESVPLEEIVSTYGFTCSGTGSAASSVPHRGSGPG